MKKIIKMVMISIILSINFFVSKEYSIYAFSEETNIDSLIENKKNQEELKSKISNIEQNLESKYRYTDDENQETESEVVSISFVEDKPELKNYLINEVTYIEEEKLDLEKQLETCMIEGIRIENINATII